MAGSKLDFFFFFALIAIVFLSNATSVQATTTYSLPEQDTLRKFSSLLYKNKKATRKEAKQPTGDYKGVFLENTTMSLSADFPLDKSTKDGKENQRIFNNTLSFGLSYNYNKFFVSFSAHKRSYRQPWNPQFTYSLGYQNWNPYSFSLYYTDDSDNNRFGLKSAKAFTNPEGGMISAEYKFLYPYFFGRPNKADINEKWRGAISVDTTPMYKDFRGLKKRWKTQFDLSVSYNPTPALSFHLTMLQYLKNQKLPWNSDFSYGVSYIIPLDTGALSLEYSNYGTTLYPWRKKHANFLAFKDGSISISWYVKLADLLARKKK